MVPQTHERRRAPEEATQGLFLRKWHRLLLLALALAYSFLLLLALALTNPYFVLLTNIIPHPCTRSDVCS